jgi:heme exporter protein D
MREFLSMSGYAGFVWPAWGLAAAVIVGLVVQTLHQLRRRRAELAVFMRHQPRSTPATGAGTPKP